MLALLQRWWKKRSCDHDEYWVISGVLIRHEYESETDWIVRYTCRRCLRTKFEHVSNIRGARLLSEFNEQNRCV